MKHESIIKYMNFGFYQIGLVRLEIEVSFRKKLYFKNSYSFFLQTLTRFIFQEMIAEIDQDGNGCISFNEFLYLMTKNVHEDGDIEEEIREAFRVFDREGHGFITVPDLCQVLTTLGDKLTEGMYVHTFQVITN